MGEIASSPLIAWESFYVIVGSSAGGLTGLQFVVVALVADSRRSTTAAEIDTFATPTIVHFCVVLFIAALLSAPWETLSSVGPYLMVFGLVGMTYVLVVLRRARRSKGYRPVFEDWLWHVLLPAVAYVVLLGAAIAIMRNSVDALFVVGAVTLLLLLIGIHNSWDTARYIAVQQASEPPAAG